MKIFIRKTTSIVAYAMIIVLVLSTSFVFATQKSATVIAVQGILREKPDIEGKVVETLPIGTKVFIQKMEKDWYQVVQQERAVEGWIYKNIVVKDDENEENLKKGIVRVGTSLNLRSMPSTESRIISQLSNGTEILVMGINEEWLEVQLNNEVKGFVHSNYVELIPNFPEGRIMVANSNIYESTNSQSKIIATLNKDDNVYIKNYDNGWYNVLTKDFIEGWIKSVEVELKINVVQPISRSGNRLYPFSNIKSVSEKYLGKPYKYGGNGPNSFDCSGFVTYILNTYYKDYLKNRGINLPRRSRDLANIGTRINRNQLQPGDLVFFNNGKSATINHVGIFIGNNEFIHASSTPGNAKVIISPLNTGHYNTRYSTAVRL